MKYEVSGWFPVTKVKSASGLKISAGKWASKSVTVALEDIKTVQKPKLDKGAKAAQEKRAVISC